MMFRLRQKMAYHQRTAGVDPYGQDGQRGEHCDEATQKQRDAPVDEALHDHLPTHGANRRAGEPGGEQGQPEEDRGGITLKHSKLLEGLVDVTHAG
jgi:hypothetical protein